MSRFRFSLTTLLLGTTAVCAVIALGVTCHELQRTRARLQHYRDQLGELTISDATRIHAIRIPTNDNTWRWRVFIPENADCSLYYRVGRVPAAGFAADRIDGTAMRMPPGEQVILAGVSYDGARRRTFRIARGGNSRWVNMAGEKGGWLDRQTIQWSRGVSIGSTVSVEPGEPLELLRLRVMEPDKPESPSGDRTTVRTSDEPADGFMIWIEDRRGQSEQGTPP